MMTNRRLGHPRMLDLKAKIMIFLVVFILLGLVTVSVDGYPMMIELFGGDLQCFQYNIPRDDDASFIAVVLPDIDDEEDTEDYYIGEFARLSRDGENFPKEFGQLSDTLEEYVTTHEEDKVPTKVRVVCFRDGKDQVVDTSFLRYYRPYIMKDIVGTSSKKGWGDEPPLEGYKFCVGNEDPEVDVVVIFDIAHWDDEPDDDKEAKAKEALKIKMIKKDHLTPLEKNFQKAESASRQIMEELRYAKKRERMLQEESGYKTSTIHMFSYLSVVVLITTAWIQIGYLKRYFKKKKLM